ncbi:hypothetical protein P9A28_gp42 [Sphingomonas phage Eidolon]|uniref:DUF3850 domain-containing protein n=1 Tax=Sphingomonas phage Eidolon TaxID=2686311 RepID=A0A6M3T815_9CAUD|nr:hypothetical protein P9A28_gp42 [Sphingomonas phage Eidolon]QJD54428.1 hypothetical protein [Sphingomonas phage Eidolon]
MNTHELKCHPHFFAAIAAGKKTFEIRRNDRDYRIGDMLNLREYDPTFGHTGRRLSGLEIVYMMMAEDFPAILPGFVIMGLRGVPSMEDDRETPAKQIGDIVKGLPFAWAKCNEYKKMAGEVMPRTCAECGLGPCKFPDSADAG